MPLLRRLLLAAAASSALFALGVFFPPLAVPCLLLVPLPGLWLATQRWSGEYVLWFILAAGATVAFWGTRVIPSFVLPFGFPALVLAVAMRRALSFDRVVCVGVAAWCVGVFALALLAFGDLATLTATARQQLTESVDYALSLYESIGIPAGTRAALEAQRDGLVTGLLESLPAIVVLIGALVVLINLALVRRATGVFGDVDLRVWRAPESMIWLLIVAGFGMFIPWPAAAVLARNAFIVLLGCYFCQGLSIVSYYFDRFHLPRGIRVVSYVLIVAQHIVAAMVLALGVFDLWGNFRRLGAGSADVPFHGE